MLFASFHTSDSVVILLIGLGSLVGGLILHTFGVVLPIGSPFVADVVMSTLGAVIVVAVARTLA
jgi:uncharacterized membrane protein YeaQ/YmgE (transglycosylase-associated protein family)